MYIFSWVELIANIPGDDGALAYILIAHKYNFKLLDWVTIAGKADIIANINQMSDV